MEQGRRSLSGIHHIKLPVHDIARTQQFYTEIMGFEYLQHFDHTTKDGTLFAVMLQGHHNGAQLLLELRKNADQAFRQQYWDPITWSVLKQKDLEVWRARFEENGVECSKVFTAMQGWVLCALDPDGKIVRMYSEESHEWTQDFDVDEFWLRM